MSKEISPDYDSLSIDTVIVTDRVEVYSNGKAWECDCGHGIGVPFNTRVVRCATCGSFNVDEKSGSREPEENKEGQSEIGDFF